MDIDVSDLSFSYEPGRTVLRDISFRVEAGDRLAILGPSGCGKTTLLKLVLGLLPTKKEQQLSPKSRIAFDNGDRTVTDLKSLGVLSAMFQEASLLPHLTVRQNVVLPFRLRDKCVPDAAVQACLAMVGLESFSDVLPMKLSGGMKTRTAMARAFVTSPRLLLLDEPFASLDLAWRTTLYSELSHLLSKSTSTLLFVTHDVEEAITLSDKVLILASDGSVHMRLTLPEQTPRNTSRDALEARLHRLRDSYVFVRETLLGITPPGRQRQRGAIA